MADPAFVQKMVLESSMAAAFSLYYEYRVRGDKFVKEIDLALINTLGMAVATGASTWLVAPSRSYGSVHKFGWQQVWTMDAPWSLSCIVCLSLTNRLAVNACGKHVRIA